MAQQAAGSRPTTRWFLGHFKHIQNIMHIQQCQSWTAPRVLHKENFVFLAFVVVVVDTRRRPFLAFVVVIDVFVVVVVVVVVSVVVIVVAPS